MEELEYDISIHRDKCDEIKRLLQEYRDDWEKFHAPDAGAAEAAAAAAPAAAAASSTITVTVLYTPNAAQVTPDGYIFTLPRGRPRSTSRASSLNNTSATTMLLK